MRFFFTLLLFSSLFHVQLLAQTSGCYVNFINPLDGSKINSLSTANLVWQNIPGAASYELWLGIDGSFGLMATLPQGINGTTTYTVTNLKGSTTYQWYPVAKNAAGGYVQSCFPVRASFTTADSPLPPACTYNIQPQNGALLITQTTAQLGWASAPITTSYDIYLWTGDIAPTQPVATSAAGTIYYNATGLLAGTTYHWYVTPRNLAGPATDCIYTQASFTTAYTIPANDDCAGALEVIPGTTVNSCGPTVVTTSIGATASPVPACTGSAEDDVWFKFTPSSKRNKVSLAVFAVINPVIELFSGNCSSLTSIGCYTTTLAPYPTVQNLLIELPALVPGQTYYYRVYGSGSNSERTKINTCITSIPDAPSNDECSAALLLTANADTSTTYSYAGATGYASQSMVSCVDPNYTAPDVWFKFVAAAGSQKISVVPGIRYDYAFQVFGGDCGNLTPLACVNNGGYSQPDSTVLNNLVVGNTYYLRVWDYHGDGAPFAQFKIVINTTQVPSPPLTNGLQAVYYNGTALSGAPLLTRIDTSINFELTYSKQPVVLSPAPGIVPEDGYSVRWSGKVQAQFSETYTFYTVADDGIRLWVNGQLLVDNWTNQGATEKSGSIALTAGQQYDIVIEYYENTGEAVAKLLWSSSSTPKQIVPKTALYPSNVVPSMVPKCTVNTSPSDGSTINPATPGSLSWNSITNASEYEVYLWTGTTAPASPVATTTVNSMSPGGLTASSIYNWYVVPKNAYGSATGCAVNKTSFTTTVLIPVNDDCTGAINVIPSPDAHNCSGFPKDFNNFGATSSMPGCVGAAEDDVWFKFTAISTKHYISLFTNPILNVALEVFAGNCQSLTPLVCTTPNTTVSNLVPGQTYYCRLYGTEVNNPRFSMSVCITTPVLAAPGCTANILPVNGSTITSPSSALLKWQAVQTALYYDLYIWSGSTPPPTPTFTLGGDSSYIVNALTPSTTYKWYVVPRNELGNSTGCASSQTSFTTAPATPPPGNGTGLQGRYFNGTTLSGAPLLTRIDTSINYELTYSKQPVILSPAPGIVPEDSYSVRWSGKVQAQFSETYTFYTVADDGIRLWVNGQLLVDNWANQGATEKSGTIALTAGQQYNIIIEYYENTGEAVAKLLWSSPSTPKQIVPKSQLYVPILTAAPSCTLNTLPANATIINTSTTASLHWNRIPEAEGYRVYGWLDNPFDVVSLATVSTNNYTLTGLEGSTTYYWYVVPFNAAGDATGCDRNTSSFITTREEPPAGNGTGLQGVYFNGTSLSGAPLLTRTDTTINFELTYSKQPVVLSPAPGIVPEDLYSVRWTGQVQPLYSETYTFYTVADDGVRLWVNGVQLVDNWTNQGATEKSGSIALIYGQKYDIVIEYYESGGEAVTKLLWSSASTTKQIVPSSQLYPPAAGARIMSSNLPIVAANLVPSTPAVSASLSPNPVRPGNLARLQINSNKAGTGVITVSSSNGRIASTEKVKFVTGTNNATINTRGLAQGLYIITVTGGSKPINLKLLVE